MVGLTDSKRAYSILSFKTYARIAGGPPRVSVWTYRRRLRCRDGRECAKCVRRRRWQPRVRQQPPAHKPSEHQMVVLKLSLSREHSIKLARQ
eukprot:6205825-Pleurochrysis_carterae.AAC.1